MNEKKLNGLSNKELLIRVLDKQDRMELKLDEKADRVELRAIAESMQAAVEATAAIRTSDLTEIRSNVDKKVNRGEMFGWLSTIAAALTITLSILL